MANKKEVKNFLNKINALKTWQLVIILILVLFVAASALRLNNVGMDQRRQSVHSADEEGNEVVLRERLLALREYSSSHMNANTGTFVLQHQYDRDSEKALAEAQARSENSESPNGNIYKKAAEICDPQFSGYSAAYMRCFVNEISKYPESGAIDDTVKVPQAELYKNNFASPVWTPDFAGWTVLAAIILSVVIISKIILTLVLKMILKRKSPQI